MRVHLITLLMGHVQDVKPCQILQNTVTLFNMQCTFTVGLFHLRPAIFSLKQVKSKLLTAPNTGKENPLCNFAFGIDDVLVIQFTATHFHTWSEAG